MFLLKKVESPREMDLQAAIRYLVFCLEKRWLRAEDYPDRKESDDFDAHSTHFLALQPGMTAEAVGTIRLIHNHDQPLPVQRYFGVEPDEGTNCAEISRLAVPLEFRSSEHMLFFGLCRVIYDEMIRASIDVVYTVIDAEYMDVLVAFGFPFQLVAGPEMVMGEETIACKCETAQIIPSLRKTDQGLADFFAKPFNGILKGV